jgi:hypothetical protein
LGADHRQVDRDQHPEDRDPGQGKRDAAAVRPQGVEGIRQDEQKFHFSGSGSRPQ